MRLDDLGVLVVDRCGAHYEFRVGRDIVGAVADGDGYPPLPEMVDVGAVVHVRAGDDQARFRKDLRQRGHGDAAYADQVSLSAAPVIIRK